MKTVFTVAVVQVGKKMLLGHKKTKIGKGYWNGFGGRLEEGESVEQAAVRELEEESGLRARKINQCGVIAVRFRDMADTFELNIFHVTQVEGEPIETREMKPKWFKVSALPYEQMWASDKLWLPLLLAGKNFAGEIKFDNLQNRELLNHDIREVAQIATGV